MNPSDPKSAKSNPFTHNCFELCTPDKPFLSSTPVASFHLVSNMSELSRVVSTPCRRTSRRRLVSTPGVSWSREREAEILTQKINSRLVELEKDGAEVVKELGKLSSRVDGMLEDVRLAVANMATAEDLRKSYQEASKVLVEAEDEIAMLAASLAQWQDSEVDSGEGDVTSNIGDSGKYLVTEPVPSPHDVAPEQVENVGCREVENVNVEELTEQIGEKKNEGLADVANQSKIYVEDSCDAKQNTGTVNDEMKNNPIKDCGGETPVTALKSFKRTDEIGVNTVTKDKLLSEVNMLDSSGKVSSQEEESFVKLDNCCYQPDSPEMPEENSRLSTKYKAMLFGSDDVQTGKGNIKGTVEQNYSQFDRSGGHKIRDAFAASQNNKVKTRYQKLATQDNEQDVNKEMPKCFDSTEKAYNGQLYVNSKSNQPSEATIPDKSKIRGATSQDRSSKKSIDNRDQEIDLEIGLGVEASNCQDTIHTSQERHRTSVIHDLANTLLKLETGYAGVLHFMEGCPSLFWVYNESRGLSKLQNYLEQRYGQGSGDGGGNGLDVGSRVLAKYSLDGRYFRARVEEVVVEDDDPAECMYSVCYVDYGNSEVVSGSEMMSWDAKLEDVPEQAVSCCLADGPAQWREDRREDGRGTWTPQQLEAFQRVINRGELKVELRSDIREKSDPRKPMFEAFVWLDGINLVKILKNQSVFAEDLANWEPAKQELPTNRTVPGEVTVKPLRRPFTTTALDPTRTPFVPTAPEMSPVHPVTLERAAGKVFDWLVNKCQKTEGSAADDGSAASIEVKSVRPEDPKDPPASTTLHNIATLPVEVDENGCFDFFLSFVENPGQFYVHPVQDELSRLDDIHEEVQRHNLPRPEERLLVVGTVWTIFHQTQNMWRRVRIEKQEESSLSVRHIDYGEIQHNVNCYDLRGLPDTWVSETPGLAVKCHLASCTPKGDAWDPESSILLGESLGYEKPCTAMAIEGEEAVGVGVVLMVNELVINQKMVEWGLAQSSVNFADIMNNNLPADWNPMEDAFVANENNYETNQEDVEMATTGYRSKETVCPQYDLNGTCFRGRMCHMLHVYVERQSAVTYDREEVAVETIDELYELRPGKPVVVRVSEEIASPGSFYAVLDPQMTNGQDTFEWFHQEMEYFYNDKIRTDLIAAPAVGELVACRNPRNNIWSRGRVVINENEVHKEEGEVRDDQNGNVDENKVSVFFVDCGFTKQIDLTDVRRLNPRFTTFPLQAIECCLAGVVPSGDVWSKEANEEFLKIVQHQRLKAQVVTFDSGRMMIDLIIPEDPEEDVNVSEELKKRNLARPAQFIPLNSQQKEEVRLPG